MGRLCGNLRTPELSDIGICACPSADSIGADPDELNIISVGDVQGVVTGLRGKQVESVVKNKTSAIHRIVSIYVDPIAPLIVGFSNVCCVIGEVWCNLLVVLRDERGVAVCCLTASVLVGISGEVNALVAAGSNRSGINDCDSGCCASGFGCGGDIANGRGSARVRGHSGVRSFGCGRCTDNLSLLRWSLDVHSGGQTRDCRRGRSNCTSPGSGDGSERYRCRSSVDSGDRSG